MKNIEIMIDKYIEEAAEFLAEEIAEGNKIELRTFVNVETGEYDVTIDETAEEGWEEVDFADTAYIAEAEAVAKLLREWEEDAEARLDPYRYNGVNPWDF